MCACGSGGVYRTTVYSGQNGDYIDTVGENKIYIWLGGVNLHELQEVLFDTDASELLTELDGFSSRFCKRS